MIATETYGAGRHGTAHSGGLAGAFAAGATQGQDRRFLASMIPAAAVTLGLFIVMTQLIRADEIELIEKDARPLFAITPQHIDSEPEISIRDVAPPVDLKLPPLPPVTRTVGNIDGFPMPVLTTGDWSLPREVISFSPPNAQPIGERVATPIRPPVAAYPPRMAASGLEGACEVHFSLSSRGLPYDVVAACTQSGFEKEAAKAVSRAEFLPEIRQGMPVESHNYVYPMEFKLQ
jgi:protein TonB